MKLRRAVTTLSLLGCLELGCLGLAAPTAELPKLRPTFGGVLLETHLQPSGKDKLSGVWSDAGLAKLLYCAPSCKVVKSIPLSGPLTLSQNSVYRVVLGGTFKIGKRVKVLLRFGQADLITLEAVVGAK